MLSATRTTVLAVGQHRGHPRIYLEGRWLVRAGFTPGGNYRATYAHHQITLDLAPAGRTISGKRSNAHGVIDLNGPEIHEAFEVHQISRVLVRTDGGRIFITPELDDPAEDPADSGLDGRLTVCRRWTPQSGGKEAGFETLAAIEMNSAYAEIYQSNHGGRMYNCSVEEVPWPELAELAPIGLLEMGIPCEPFSQIRRLDRGGQIRRQRDLPPEAHELGDMVYWALKAADVLNPHTILIEEVPKFLTSGAGYILRLALARMGYTVDARAINAADHGALTARIRAVIVATSFDQVRWPEAQPATRRLSHPLDPVSDESPLWFDRITKPWLYEHWARQTAKGNGFQPPQLTAADTLCPTIKKRYFAGQGDDVVVRHPHQPDHHRWLTLAEVQRLMGLPEDYDLGDAMTTAGEVLGQGVQVETFTRIIRSVMGH